MCKEQGIECLFLKSFFVMISAVRGWKGLRYQEFMVKIVGTDWICLSLLYKNGIVFNVFTDKLKKIGCANKLYKKYFIILAIIMNL